MKTTFNKFSFVILFVIFNTYVFSQTNAYKPFPLQKGTWVVDYEDITTTTGNINKTQYSIDGDTIIGSYIYKKVNCANYTGFYTGFISNGYGPSTFCFAFRNDIPNKKVFIYKNIAGLYKDTLWYDFNLTIGDTLKNKTFAFDSSGVMPPAIVTSIDSTLICGEYNKTFRFGINCSFGNLIEGVGFTSSFVQTSSIEMCAFEPTYMHTTTFSCTSVSVNELSNSSENSRGLFPNPVINILQINYADQNLILPIAYSIFDYSGRIVCNDIYTDDKVFDVSKLKSGLYLIRLQDKQQKTFQSRFVKQ